MEHNLKLVLLLIQRTLSSHNRIHTLTLTLAHVRTHKIPGYIIELFLVILLRFTVLHYFTMEEPTIYLFLFILELTFFFLAVNNWQRYSLALLARRKNADLLK